MANLSLISTCNRHCSYCFAAGTMDRADTDRRGMSLDQCDAALDFLERSEMREARLLGGEPTIHPEFVEIVRRVRARGMSLLLFTGGMIPRPALDCLLSLPPGEVRILLNVAVEGESPPAEIQRQREVCSALGERVALGINIHSPAVELGFLFDMIHEYQLAKVVRMGLTHPMLEGGNQHLHPRFFKLVGQKVAHFAYAARDRGIQLEFDCGWVPCMFPEGILTDLGITPREVGLRCNPILDVMPDGHVIPCYPLASQFTEPLSGYTDAAALNKRFVERLAPLRSLGIFSHCADCDFRARGECAGGCLSLSQRRLRTGNFDITLSDVMTPTGINIESHSPTLISVALPVLSPTGACGCSDHGGCHTSTKSRVELLPIVSLSEIKPLAIESTKLNAPLSVTATNRWSLPYIDQPVHFWQELKEELGAQIDHVYFPLPGEVMGSGRPRQSDMHLDDFLKEAPLRKAVLLNAITLPQPVNDLAPRVISALERLQGDYDVNEVVVADLLLARRLREAFPALSITASVLMEIAEPYQARLLAGVCDTLVPASRVVRDLPALRALRDAFPGRLRLLVNEACLPGCPYRVQHFHEMASGIAEPKSLCVESLHDEPWLRLTGSWVLPQHLHHYAEIYDELKLAGRVTLRDPEKYRHVVRSYVHRQPLRPYEIGGGPASVLEPIEMSDELFAFTLTCGRRCHECTRCPDYYVEAIASQPVTQELAQCRGLVGTNCW